jgi:hypothetical protein
LLRFREMRASVPLPLLSIVLLVCSAASARADPVAVRLPEGSSHGFAVLRDANDRQIAAVETLQTPEGDGFRSRLVFRFEDGSLYDERVTFSQKRVFRLLSYSLVQKGPSFPESSEVSFDGTGHYRARSGDAKPVEGTIELPDDVHNGMTGMLIRNLPEGATSEGHILAFTPEPRLLRSTLRREGTDEFVVANRKHEAARYLVDLDLGGVQGVVAAVLGKSPPDVRFWVSTGPVPTFLRFEGALWADGPVWQIAPVSPRWPEGS